MTALASGRHADARKDRKRMDLVKLATGFTKTSPEIFGPTAFDAKGNLSNSMQARFWLGVCKSFGLTFELKEPIDITSIICQRKEEQKAQATKTLKFHPDKKRDRRRDTYKQSGNVSVIGRTPIKTTIGTSRTTKETMKEAPILYETTLPSNAPGVGKSEEACSNFRWAINRNMIQA
jgi:hypothetical protein